MNLFPPEFIETIKNHPNNRIETIIDTSGIDLKQSGGEFVGYHSNKLGSDSKTSLHVDTEKGLYFCFNCHEGGDVHRWLELNQNLTFIETCIHLAKRAGLSLPNVNPEEQKQYVAFRQERAELEKLYNVVASIYHEQLNCQNEAVYGLVTCWVIATYFHRFFNAFPYLFFYGKKGSGKSRSLDLLERIAFNAAKIKGISVAALADTIDGVRGTFLNDQTEALSDPRNVELLGIHADSYTPGGGKRRVISLENKKRRILEFEPYGPKAYASIREIHWDLKDRCVEIVMTRAEKDLPYPEPYLPLWEALRDKLYRLLLTKWLEVKDIYPTTGAEVKHRIRELWRPLETILELEKVPKDEQQAIKVFFLKSMQETQSELSDRELELFEVLLTMLESTAETVFTVNEIASRFKLDEIKDEREKHRQEKGLQIWTGRALRQFNLYDHWAGRKDKKRAYAFSRSHVEEILKRYSSIEPLQSNGFNGHMVCDQENEASTNDHSKKVNGQQWSGKGQTGNSNGMDDQSNDQKNTERPLKTIEKNSMVNCEGAKNKGCYHMTKETITYQDMREIII